MKAFPTPSVVEDTGTQYQTTSASSGMDLRDYFAAKALQSLISLCYEKFDVAKDKEILVQDSYEIADAMIEARK